MADNQMPNRQPDIKSLKRGGRKRRVRGQRRGNRTIIITIEETWMMMGKVETDKFNRGTRNVVCVNEETVKG
jgi:hypothetical protein